MRKIIIVIILIWLISELFAKFILLASDSPDIYFDNNLGIMYLPNQTGIYIKNKNIKANYNINQQGWNSINNYRENKEDNVFRIAIIGDSFVESLQIDATKSFSYLLENRLENKMVEVYPIAHSGSNLIQYLHFMKYSKDKYNPNLFIVNIVGNDFEESINGMNRTDNWSVVENNKKISEIPPQKTKNMYFKKILRKSALIRYLTINKDVLNNSKLVNKIFYYGLKSNSQTRYDYNIENVISYALDKYKEIAGENLLIILNDNKYYDISKQIIENKNIKYVSTKDTIGEKDYFQSDLHWNENGHQKVFELLFNNITNNYYDTK